MATNKPRICVLCGKEYHYCPSCYKDKDLAPWHIIYCSDNCKDVFETLNDYNFKKISKQIAKQQLSKCDLSKLEEYSDGSKDLISEIMGKDKKKTDAE